MGGVNTSPDYVTTVGIGLPNGTFTNTTHQSGIVSIVSQNIDFRCVSKSLMVYSTTLALLSVPSSADGLPIALDVSMGFSAQPAAIFSLIGGALQTATQNLKFILVASKVTGIGNGAAFWEVFADPALG